MQIAFDGPHELHDRRRRLKGSDLGGAEFVCETIRCQRLLAEMGFPADGYPLYPGVKGNYCCADSVGGFVVDSTGALYKCWNDIGDPRCGVGSILRQDAVGSEQQMPLPDFPLWPPFASERSRTCDTLPICMGGCPCNGLR